MDVAATMTILGVMFWVLAALEIVSFMILVYTCVQRFKWDKENRQQYIIEETIKKTIEELDVEQYDDFETTGGGNYQS